MHASGTKAGKKFADPFEQGRYGRLAARICRCHVALAAGSHCGSHASIWTPHDTRGVASACACEEARRGGGGGGVRLCQHCSLKSGQACQVSRCGCRVRRGCVRMRLCRRTTTCVLAKPNRRAFRLAVAHWSHVGCRAAHGPKHVPSLAGGEQLAWVSWSPRKRADVRYTRVGQFENRLECVRRHTGSSHGGVGTERLPCFCIRARAPERRTEVEHEHLSCRWVGDSEPWPEWVPGAGWRGFRGSLLCPCHPRFVECEQRRFDSECRERYACRSVRS
mmetsp:Transcript_7507/g.19612  ORF Transcript_7507/g.19612 Transcript_7507/m.19612 type:complete len:277 (-) Transcript_7507:12-842(-)